MEFVCKYAKPTGEIVTVVQVGTSAEDIRHRLQEQGFLPMSVRSRGWGFSFSTRRRRQEIKADDFIRFNQQFVALIRAGLPILRALDLLKAQVKNPVLNRHITNIRDRVHAGTLLSEAIRSQGVFPAVYTASIFAGERSGNLVEVITRYIQYEKTIVTVRRRFLNSLIYPAFLIVVSMVMVSVIVTYVIPQFAELYSSLNAKLPLSTRILIAVSSIVRGNLVWLVPSIVVSAVALRLWIGTVAGRKWLDELKLKVPLLGNLWTMFSMAQLSRTLATLLQGGTPLLAALHTARDASGNIAIAESIDAAMTQVREGRPLSDSLEETRHFPDLAIEMVRVGEQTGSMPEMLNHVADYYDEDVNIRSAALLSWVEPVILIFVAIFIAAILISLYLPVFSIAG